MKKAFTLIELLVVIAIIAILAAILFPVFAQAKLAAKKTQGLSQAKQIGTAMQLYVNDFDDVLFMYRANGPTGQTINPTYQQLVATRGQAYADQVIGPRSRNVIFFNQLLFPYTKNDDLWKAPTNPNGWVNFDPTGNNQEPDFRSYGGQNSYGVNNYVFTARVGNSAAGGGLSYGQIDQVSNTLVMVDAMYYNVLPRFTGRLNGAPNDGSGINPCGSDYPNYWKSLGNSYFFGWPTSNRPDDAKALRDIDARYSGVLNVVRADSSAKSYATSAVINDLRDKREQSMWDPYKQGHTPCN